MHKNTFNNFQTPKIQRSNKQTVDNQNGMYNHFTQINRNFNTRSNINYEKYQTPSNSRANNNIQASQESILKSKSITYKEIKNPYEIKQPPLPSTSTFTDSSFSAKYAAHIPLQQSPTNNQINVGLESVHPANRKCSLNESKIEENGPKRIKYSKNEEQIPFNWKTENSNICVLTGTVERVIKWNKIYKNFCFYEVYGSLVSIQNGTIRMQKIMLLRDQNGPIMQIVHYESDHIQIDNFTFGQMLRCMGRMVGPNILHAISIREATSGEVSNLLRMCYICDHKLQEDLL